jgi:hypothetical protein
MSYRYGPSGSKGIWAHERFREPRQIFCVTSLPTSGRPRRNIIIFAHVKATTPTLGSSGHAPARATTSYMATGTYAVQLKSLSAI